jgi:hypothetical protein
MRICSRSKIDDRHMRGLDEKIWKVLQAKAAAFSAAPAREPAIEVWIPMRSI